VTFFVGKPLPFRVTRPRRCTRQVQGAACAGMIVAPSHPLVGGDGRGKGPRNSIVKGWGRAGLDAHRDQAAVSVSVRPLYR
jgi:hypothetical protein